MSQNRQRQFDLCTRAILYPILGVIPGFLPFCYGIPALPLILLVVGLAAGAQSFYEALENAPEVRPIAMVLYIPVMMSFIVGFCLLFGIFLHLFWVW